MKLFSVCKVCKSRFHKHTQPFFLPINPAFPQNPKALKNAVLKALPQEKKMIFVLKKF